jgi:hypothetical protein
MFTAPVARAHPLTIRAIMLGKMFPGSRIRFGLSLGTGLGTIRPVCALTGVRSLRERRRGPPIGNRKKRRGLFVGVSDSAQ